MGGVVVGRKKRRKGTKRRNLIGPAALCDVLAVKQDPGSISECCQAAMMLSARERGSRCRGICGPSAVLLMEPGALRADMWRLPLTVRANYASLGMRLLAWVFPAQLSVPLPDLAALKNPWLRIKRRMLEGKCSVLLSKRGKHVMPGHITKC